MGGAWPRFGQKSLADLEIARGDWPAALRHLDSASALARATGDVSYANGLAHPYALVALKQGHLDEARRLLDRHIAVLEDDPQRSRRYVAHTMLGAVYARQGDLDRAVHELTSAADTLDAWRKSLGTADLRLAAYAVREEDLATDFGFVGALGDLVRGGRTGAAFALAERRRARDLSDRMLQVTTLATAADSSAHASRHGTGVPFAAAGLRDAIPDDATALVEFVVSTAADSSIAFIVTRTGIQAALLPPGAALAELTETMLALVESGEHGDSLPARAGRSLLAPVLALLPAAVHRLVLVPDGPLHRLPFDALVLGDGRRVAERYEVSLSPSATISARLWQRTPSTAATTLLAFAGIDSRGQPGLPLLPASAREAREAGRMASASVIRLGADASESYLKASNAANYRILHFATHALVDDESLDGTALVLAAGAGEDGLMSPAELAALHLDADLVVLSGCRTARGVVFSGEGVQGLAGPLLEAGSRSVLATLWSVNDRDAAGFVGDFYRAATGGTSVGDALATAKRTAIARGEPPATWAAFVLVGNPAVQPPVLASPVGIAWPGGTLAFGVLITSVSVGILLLAWRARSPQA